MLMLVMTLTRGVITLVASNLPPMPTSTTAMSTFCLLKYSKARAVVASKNVQEKPLSLMSSAKCLIPPRRWSTSAWGMGSPSTVILSLKSSMWGEV